MIEYYHADRLQLRRGGHAQPARVRPGLLREAGRRRRGRQADRAPLQDAGLRARASTSACPQEIRARPPTTDTYSLPQTQEEFYFALPYDQMDLCLYALQPRRPGGGGRAGGRARPPSRSSASTGTSRRSGAPRATCTRGRCSSTPRRGRASELDVRHRRHRRARATAVAARDSRRSRAWPARCTTAAPTSSASTATRAPASRTRGSRSSISPTGQQPLSNEDGTLWIVFNGEIFNYVELRAELAALGHAFRTQQRHRGHRPRLRGVGRARRSRASTASGRWRCGTRGARRWCSRAIGSACGRSTCASTAGALCFASEVKAHLRRRPDRSRARSTRAASTETFTFWTVVAAAVRVFAGVERARARATCASTQRGTVTRARVLAAALPGERRATRFRGHARRRGRARCATALDDATALRMLRADVPVGSYLSGGLDSSLVAALGARAQGDELLHVLAALRGRRVRRDARSSARWRRHRQRAPRGGGARARDIADVVPRGRPPHRAARSCAPRPRRSSCCRGWCASAASRWCSPAKAPTRCSPATTCSARPRSAGSGRASPTRQLRPRLLERLYPVPRALAGGAARDGARSSSAAASNAGADPGFAHETRWQATARLQRLFTPDLRA